MALEACNFEGSFLVRGRNDVDIDAFIYSLSKVGPSALIIAPIGRRRSLLKCFPTKLNENTSFINISKSSTIEDILRRINNDSVCVLDSLDLLIMTFGIDNVCKLIFKIKGSRFVLAACRENTVSLAEWNRLKTVADSSFNISCNGSTVLAEGVSYKKNGKIGVIKETVEILSGLKLKSRKHEEAVMTIDANEPIPSAQFNMGLTLKDSERIAKEDLKLPYMSTSNAEELVNLRSSEKKVRVGGQIIYTPEDADDLDDSDPDDDLNL